MSYTTSYCEPYEVWMTSHHSEDLGRFRGKLASDALELLTKQKWHLPYSLRRRFRFVTYVRFAAYSFVLKALYTSDEQAFLRYILYIISINWYYRSKYFLA